MDIHNRDRSCLHGRRVLIVEDELLVAMELESLLEEQGCLVLGPASSVRAALEAVAADGPDAVLLDLNLHGERSTPIAEMLAARGIPYVIASGYEVQGFPESVIRNAPSIRKPVDHHRLIRLLGDVLEQHAVAGHWGQPA